MVNAREHVVQDPVKQREVDALHHAHVIEWNVDAGGRQLAQLPAAVSRQSEGRPKYVVCNADEGDPGAFMDRAILEGDPHAVVEGMLLGAYAMGSEYGFIYVREEYPIAPASVP